MPRRISAPQRFSLATLLLIATAVAVFLGVLRLRYFYRAAHRADVAIDLFLERGVLVELKENTTPLLESKYFVERIWRRQTPRSANRVFFLRGVEAGQQELNALAELGGIEHLLLPESIGRLDFSPLGRIRGLKRAFGIPPAALPSIGLLQTLEMLEIRAPARDGVFGTLTPAEEAGLARCTQVEELKIRLEGDEIRLLENLRALRRIDLSASVFSGESLSILGGTPDLTDLRLDDTDVTDDSLQSIATKPSLESIRLRRCNVTDDCLKHLVHLPNLVLLDVAYTNVSVDGLRNIGFLDRKIQIEISHTQCTKEEAEKIDRDHANLDLWFFDENGRCIPLNW